METTLPATVRHKLAWRDLRLATKLWLLGLLLVPTLLGLEVLARWYWVGRQKLPAVNRENLWKHHFPEWDRSGVETTATDHGGATFDVLLLGGSALVQGFGDIETRLRDALAARLQRPVQVVNLAFLGRTTRDSRIKYERLAERRFDLVVVYHGINDTFLNNCPASAFRADYTHADRFRDLRALEQHREFGLLTLPYTARHLTTALLDRAMLSNRPRKEWHDLAAEPKTPPAFEDNLERITSLADERGDPIVLMTYAYHIPSNYTEAAFAAKQLDYANHGSPLHLWGKPGPVAQAIDAHNQAVRRVVARHPEALFVDQKGLLPVGQETFNDCCHLTAKGCERFVWNVMVQIEAARFGVTGGRSDRQP